MLGRRQIPLSAALISLLPSLLLLPACSGDDGKAGSPGPAGQAGLQGQPGAACSASEVAATLAADPAFRLQVAADLVAHHADELRGPAGEQGPAGDQGPAGQDGQDGRDGRDGASPAVEDIAAELAAAYADELRGPQGPQGPRGRGGVAVYDAGDEEVGILFGMSDGHNFDMYITDIDSFYSYPEGESLLYFVDLSCTMGPFFRNVYTAKYITKASDNNYWIVDLAESTSHIGSYLDYEGRCVRYVDDSDTLYEGRMATAQETGALGSPPYRFGQ